MILIACVSVVQEAAVMYLNTHIVLTEKQQSITNDNAARSFTVDSWEEGFKNIDVDDSAELSKPPDVDES